MNNELSCECLDKIQKYKRYKREWQKVQIRNETFALMAYDMTFWIKSILRKWHKYETKEEILSLSWDCFEFCLKHFKVEGTHKIESHFYKYTSYYLLNRYAKKDRVFLPIDELKGILGVIETPENLAFEKLLTLTQFRNVIPEKYLVIWDDAVLSQSEANQFQQRTRGNIGVKDSTYRAIKEILKNIVKELMK